jgi:hypothetical protein
MHHLIVPHLWHVLVTSMTVATTSLLLAALWADKRTPNPRHLGRRRFE